MKLETKRTEYPAFPQDYSYFEIFCVATVSVMVLFGSQIATLLWFKSVDLFFFWLALGK